MYIKVIKCVFYMCTHAHLQTVNLEEPEPVEMGKEGEEEEEEEEEGRVTDVDEFNPPLVMKPSLKIPG